MEIVKRKCKDCTEGRLNDWKEFLSKIDNPERFARLFEPGIEFPVIRAPSEQELGFYKRLQQAEEDKLIVKDAKVEPYQPSEGERYVACMNQFHNQLKCNEAGDRLAIGVIAGAAAIAAIGMKAEADFERELAKLPPEEQALIRQRRKARFDQEREAERFRCESSYSSQGYGYFFIQDHCQ